MGTPRAAASRYYTTFTPKPPPHPRPPSLDLVGRPDLFVEVTHEVRVDHNRCQDKRDVGLGERVAELLLVSAQQIGDLRIAQRRLVLSPTSTI